MIRKAGQRTLLPLHSGSLEEVLILVGQELCWPGLWGFLFVCTLFFTKSYFFSEQNYVYNENERKVQRFIIYLLLPYMHAVVESLSHVRLFATP